jgi:hypothetical protein
MDICDIVLFLAFAAVALLGVGLTLRGRSAPRDHLGRRQRRID